MRGARNSGRNAGHDCGFAFSLIQEGVILGQLVWSLTGSKTANWIVDTLSAIACLIVIIGVGWFFTRIPEPAALGIDKRASFAVVGVAALIYWFVSSRLLVWRNPAARDLETAERAGAQNP